MANPSDPPAMTPEALLQGVADKINEAVGALLTEDGVPARDSEIACDALDEAQQALSAARRAITRAASPTLALADMLTEAIQAKIYEADRLSRDYQSTDLGAYYQGRRDAYREVASAQPSPAPQETMLVAFLRQAALDFREGSYRPTAHYVKLFEDAAKALASPSPSPATTPHEDK